MGKHPGGFNYRCTLAFLEGNAIGTQDVMSAWQATEFSINLFETQYTNFQQMFD